jgi:hypothetical protein
MYDRTPTVYRSLSNALVPNDLRCLVVIQLQQRDTELALVRYVDDDRPVGPRRKHSPGINVFIIVVDANYHGSVRIVETTFSSENFTVPPPMEHCDSNGVGYDHIYAHMFIQI